MDAITLLTSETATTLFTFIAIFCSAIAAYLSYRISLAHHLFSKEWMAITAACILIIFKNSTSYLSIIFHATQLKIIEDILLIIISCLSLWALFGMKKSFDTMTEHAHAKSCAFLHKK